MKYTVYHGTNAEFDMFSPEYTGKGNDQIGSGFYFADNKEVAMRYGNNILKCEIEINNPIRLTKEHANLRDINLHLNKKQVADIIKLSPNIYDMDETPLWNYSDISGYSKEDLDYVIDGIAEDFVENEYDNLMYLENDFYRDYSTEFRTAINKVLGYDSVIQTFDDGNFYVCWFPEQIKILETLSENYQCKDTEVAYRGMDRDAKISYNKPQWFSSNKMIARSYGKVIYKAELKLNNPLDLTNPKNNHLFKEYFEVTDEKIEQKFQKIFDLMDTIEGKDYDKKVILDNKFLLNKKEYKKFADIIYENCKNLRIDWYDINDVGCQIGKLAREIVSDVLQKDKRDKMIKGELPFFADWCYSNWDKVIEVAKKNGYDSIINMEEDNHKQYTDIGFVVWNKKNIISMVKDDDFRESTSDNIYEKLNEELRKYL